ncbi:enoyl-CoA hydratase [Breoghania sp.]|uniref:enoyl-CoA hydratase n=1 Tax=Breoghania sp. TaxID=2065378 RepID=UPI002AA7943C|nr:enoyl-CoA hydratase [Breoghania sp.]
MNISRNASESDEASPGRITLLVEPPIGWLVIDNEPRRNAISLAMWEAVPAAVSQLTQDDRVHVIVVRGAGDATFISGADISEFAETRKDAKSARAYEDENSAAFDAVRACEKPTIAMIRGFCMGGGLGLSAACDMRFATRKSCFSIPAARLGLAYPARAISDLTSLIGPSRTKDLFFSARRFDGEEAFSMGLVDRLIDESDLEAETRAYAQSIATNAPLVVRAAKASINAVACTNVTADWIGLDDLNDACFDSDDFAEGRNAFLERRTPKFTGR